MISFIMTDGNFIRQNVFPVPKLTASKACRKPHLNIALYVILRENHVKSIIILNIPNGICFRISRPEGVPPSITPGASRGTGVSQNIKPRRGVTQRVLSHPLRGYATSFGITPRLAPGVIDGCALFRAHVQLIMSRVIKVKKIIRFHSRNSLTLPSTVIRVIR